MVNMIFAVRDTKADVFGRPFIAPNEGTAMRSLSEEVNRAEMGNNFYSYPEDFDLYSIGRYDDHSGTIEALKIPLRICGCTQLSNRLKAQNEKESK